MVIRLADPARVPSYSELPLVGGLPSSWGLWGDDDRLGCLNLLTPERTALALAGVQCGDVFSLNWTMTGPEPALFGRPSLRHDIVRSPTSPSLNDVISDWNTQSSSQWDGFGHVVRAGFGTYGGVDADAHGVDDWARRGIVGSAVLADVARWRESVGRPLRHEEPDPIGPEDVLQTLSAQGVEVRTGDILVIRTGWIEWYERLAPAERAALATGDGLRNPEVVPTEQMAQTLWDLHPAAVACDNPAVEVWPLGSLLPKAEADAVLADPARRHEISLHTRLLPMLGLPLGELWDLAALAADCVADGVYRFCLTSAPIALRGGAASPANALAVK